MALPTLEWLISDEQVFGLDDVEFSDQDLSAHASSRQCVNFLKFIERHINDHSNYFEPVASAYDSTDGTLILGLNASPSSGNQRLSGINLILGTSTLGSTNFNDGNIQAYGGTQGAKPHDVAKGATHDIIWMTMTMGMANPQTPAGVALNPSDWRIMDWSDNAQVPYSSGTPRFIGFAAMNSNMLAAGDDSDFYGFRIIESAEAIFFSIRRTPSNKCFIGGAGAFIVPQDSDYAETPGTGGWNDSSGVGTDGENNRLFGIMSNPVFDDKTTVKTSSDFWNETTSSVTLLTSGYPGFAENLNHPVFSIYDPLTQGSGGNPVNRIAKFNVTQQYAGDLSTISGKRVHLDIPVKLHENPYYFLGSLRQIRVGQDTVCGTTIKDGSGATKSILWTPDASVASNAIAFDNE